YWPYGSSTSRDDGGATTRFDALKTITEMVGCVKPKRAARRAAPLLLSPPHRPLAEPDVGEGDRHHALGDRDHPGADAGVVASLDRDDGGASGAGGGGLWLPDRGGGAHRRLHHDLGAIGDPARDPAREVAEEALTVEDVVGLGAVELAHRESAADLHSLGGRDREQGGSEQRVELRHG